MLRKSKTFKIVFDKLGGAILFNRHYARIYDDGKQLACDVICLLAGGDARTWDGSDDDLLKMMCREDLTTYESSYSLPEIAMMLAERDVIVDDDTVSLLCYSHHGRISGPTEATFFRTVSGQL